MNVETKVKWTREQIESLLTAELERHGYVPMTASELKEVNLSTRRGKNKNASAKKDDGDTAVHPRTPFVWSNRGKYKVTIYAVANANNESVLSSGEVAQLAAPMAGETQEAAAHTDKNAEIAALLRQRLHGAPDDY